MRILVADDEPINRLLLQKFLDKWDYDVVVSEDGDQAWNILQRPDTPTLAILDWMMPGMDGLQICREVRKRSNEQYIYILLLTARFQKTDIIAGFEAGADDYLTKPFDANELKARLRTGRRILDLQEQLLATNERLKFKASHDPLTGLWSREDILEVMRAELARALRGGTNIGIVLADLDHFKAVNDTYGHLAGDAVLRETAKRMRSSTRLYDSVGRYGGEEFLIVLPDCDIAGALTHAERLRAAIGNDQMDTSEGIIPVTLSLGLTISGGAAPSEMERLLRAADIALYQAKKGGRNRVEVFRENPEANPTGSQHPASEGISSEG